MPPDEEPDRGSSMKAKRIKCLTKYCIFVTVCCISIVIIPGLYIMYELDEEASNSKIYTEPEDYKGKTFRSPLPWYMSRGTKYPGGLDGSNKMKIWPEEEISDRIENQLMFKTIANSNFVKTIVIYNKIQRLKLYPGRKSFFNCPEVSCTFSENISDIETADAVFFSDEQLVLPTFKNSRPSHQVWILFLSQNPYYTKGLGFLSGMINWTSSYRSDSDVVAPYNKWVYHNNSFKQLPIAQENFAEGKNKKVVWFVRDYRQGDSRRREYAEALSWYIQVDIFGGTEDHQCPCVSPDHCFELFHQYKFFLAFEKFSCRDYITEGFFLSLQRGVLPLVMGASYEDYLKFAPHHSYIHVDKFSSPEELAKYLHRLDQNDDLYNEYFRWKGTGELIDTRVECRICALLHSGRSKNYADVNSWWKKDICRGQYHT